MKYFFDFDRVLFDLAAVNIVVTEQFPELQATPEVWDHIKASDFLYPDAIPFLEKLPKEEIAIISAYTPQLGEKTAAYQDRKLTDSGIANYVAEVVVMTGDKAPHIAQRLTGTGFFIDDKRRYVEEVALGVSTISAIQLLRPNQMRSTFDNSAHPELAIPVVKNLTQAAAMMRL